MTGRLRTRIALPGILAAVVTLAGCGSEQPSEPPYIALGRDMVGVYTSQTPTTHKNLEMALGSRYSVSGKYDGAAGVVRFYGEWERRGSTLYITLEPQAGLPPAFEFDVTREQLRTEISPETVDMRETVPAVYLEQDIVRLHGTVIIEGEQIQIDLIRVINDIVSGGGDQTAN